jgi:hypothetical protein
MSKTAIKWDLMETGDLILFHGEKFWFSYVVEWFSWSEFSHIAIILRDPVYIKPELTGLYMLESGIEKFPDAVEHRVCYGVQIVNLQKVIDNYNGSIYTRKLTVPTTFRTNMEAVLTDVWNTIKDKTYDDNVWDLMKVLFQIKWGNDNRYDKFFCSALVAFLYERFGYFRHEIQWDLIEPKDFDNTGRVMALLVPDKVTLEPKVKIC